MLGHYVERILVFSRLNRTHCLLSFKLGTYPIRLFNRAAKLPKRCPQELYGKDCINKCHCSRGESCDQISGICKNGCEDGWRGEKCDNQTYVNIAQGKQTYQTSTLEWDKVIALPNGKCVKNKMWMSSGKAVDGNFDHVFEHMSCTHTTSEQDPYWEVTLDKPYMISQLRIYNRMTHYFRLSGFKVYLGSSLCFESTKDEYKKQVIYIKCQKPVYTSNVKISLEGKKKALTLCEVEVIQCYDIQIRVFAYKPQEIHSFTFYWCFRNKEFLFT
ncbi:fucolectin-5 [Octopus bimaculoides]|uniref:fucolectin-5 n=1 Tax=Octopus bimaculoides TaxID=37653 RepID=UPI0022E334F8|nr:fucolectin-5 [Octopus bimaculoides]